MRVDAGTVLRCSNFRELKTWVLEQTGLHYYADRDEDFASRVARRMEARNIPDCGMYLATLTPAGTQGVELDALIGELTIGETYFFRQRKHFALLRSEIIPEILQRNADSRRIRIWSAGCATGAEAYSVALLLRRDFPGPLTGWDVSILGTDINVDFLAQAREGIYRTWALRELTEDVTTACFEAEGDLWRLRPLYKRGVSFEYNNLAGPHPFPGSSGDPFDLILCRNVFLYFSRQRIKDIADRLYCSLGDGGWLLVGHAEADAEFFSQFSAGGEPGSAAYRRLPRVVPIEIPVSPASAVRTPATARHRRERKPARAPAQPSLKPVPPSGTSLSDVSIDDARMLADAGHFERAGDICRQLIETNPLNPLAHFTLGLVFEHTSSAREAESAFRRAIYLDRGLALAHYHCGTAQQALGNFASARKSFGNVIVTLTRLSPEDAVPHGDGMTADELSALARMHLETLPPDRGPIKR